VSQTLSLYRQDLGNGTKGDALVAYSALGSTGAHWRVRGAVSWWRWQPDAATGQANDSGIGTLDVTVGRSFWESYGPGHSSRLWAQVGGVIPLDNTPSPVSSGQFDWSFSLLSTNRFENVLVFAELGYLNPGDPVGVTYNGQFTGAISASWHRHGWPVYPVASYFGAGPVVEGGPGYGEWSAGLGAILGRRTGILALYSHGTTAGSPEHGFTTVFALRL
jgi:hypothetical protein